MTPPVLKLAVKEAQTPRNAKHWLGAVTFNGPKIISSGRNDKRYAHNLHPKFKKAVDSFCAEKAAVLNARTDLRRASLLVVRVKRDGSLGMAKPCPSCILYLDYVGIKSVFYSTSDGEILKTTPKILMEEVMGGKA